MKRFASLALIATFAVAPLALAEDQPPKVAQPQKAHRRPAPVASRPGGNPTAARRFPSQPGMQAGVSARSGGNSARFQGGMNRPNFNRPSGEFRRSGTPRVYQTPNVQNNVVNADSARRSRDRNGNNNSSNQWRGNGSGRGDQWRGNDNANTNWRNRGGVSSGRWANYRNWERTRHDRSYWRSRYTRFALFGGGYYYYNSGFWYPAYGYDPYFSTYSYNAPIYAYNDQDPGQVVANVQTALLRRGYNPGPIDGTYGPATRNALANFQSDNGLEVSGEIDEGTLDSLGLQ